jgi:formamidopyrimidine-DNA glycosylase
MGKLYLTPEPDLVPTFPDQGPDALDPNLTLEAFTERLGRRRGEIKGILTNQSFVAGIGNAYSDEILFHSGVYPFRKRPSLTSDEVRRTYAATQHVLRSAISTLRQRMGSDIHIELRDFLQVHGRGGQPCPRCGRAISTIRARRRLTNFCRNCQPGLMVTN